MAVSVTIWTPNRSKSNYLEEEKSSPPSSSCSSTTRPGENRRSSTQLIRCSSQCMPTTKSQSSRSPSSTATVAHHRPHLLHLNKLGIHNLAITRWETTLIKSNSASLFPFSSCLSENDWPVLPLWVCWSAALRFCCSFEWRKCRRCRCCLCDQFYRFWWKTNLLTEDIRRRLLKKKIRRRCQKAPQRRPVNVIFYSAGEVIVDHKLYIVHI